jgi:hypothetical protein
MPTVTVLATAHLNHHSPQDAIRIELIEHLETPAAVREPALIVIHWPAKATMAHQQRFPEVAATAARLFATAATELASIKSRRRL